MSEELIRGHDRFRTSIFPEMEERFRRLVDEGQRPHTLFIGCSDSRVIPSLLTATAPGELFVVRNVGALVPPYELDQAHHGVSSAIEYAVLILGVSDIVVCGHSHCGAIQALYQPPPAAAEHVARWVRLAEAAKVDGPVDEALLRRTEQRSVVVQLDHLMGFPFVAEAVDAGRLALHGWHYVVEDGALNVLDVNSGRFERHGAG
ncbi:MAG TPA: carbonic anhydrase [Longimicrobiales bacterium]|nr:carbonic anhydrase [Longimicrobiales bacterium]